MRITYFSIFGLKFFLNDLVVVVVVAAAVVAVVVVN